MMRNSFVSREDFHMAGSNDYVTLRDSQLLTPRVLRSRGTSVGHPDYEQVKNNLQEQAINDSISSN